MIPPGLSSFGKAVWEKIFKYRPIRNKNCLWRPYLLTDQGKMSNLYRGSFIDASYKISVIGFRGDDFLKSANQKQKLACGCHFC
jgi:hypothetical protein